ncbi:hypothetical protein K8R30_04695 [archaeon]|nr:hypothetical protein [archaeon]
MKQQQTQQLERESGKYILKRNISFMFFLFCIPFIAAENLTISSSTTLCGNYEYDNVLIESGVTVTVCDYNGTEGTGVLNFSAEDTFTLESGATINGNGKGYRGGAKATMWDNDGSSGEGDGAGGAGVKHSTGDPYWLGGGGGAGYGGAGGTGGEGGLSSAYGGTGGSSYGNQSVLDVMFLGSGGGSGPTAPGSDGDGGTGGDGGGAFILYARNVSINGQIQASGNSGQYGEPYGDARFGGSGGGSGGSIFIKGKFVNINSATLRANAGSGSDAYFYVTKDGAAGGGGGGAGGRITIAYQYTLQNSSSTISVSAGSGGDEDDGGSDGNSGSLGVIYYTQDGDFPIETIEELISFYSFDYSEGNITVSQTGDYMIDLDSNGINDTLFFNLTIGNTTNGNYEIYVDIDDNGTVVTEGIVSVLGASFSNVSLNISTELLSGIDSFEYTIRIYDNESNLVYRKGDLVSNNYNSYETGPTFISISDSNINNDSIMFNVTLNLSSASVRNISVYLNYDYGSLSSINESVNLSSGINNVLIYFDNESIKRTHYNGGFVISGISVGEKNIPLNISTSNYSYEDFAKTSYVKSYNSSKIDLDSNNLTDYLEINTTINVLDSGNYTLILDVYDLYGESLITLEKNATLTTGFQHVLINISGEHIYSSQVSGPYEIAISNLFYDSELIDSELSAYLIDTGNSSYFDFERPPRPDLEIINMTTSFNDTHNSFNVTVKNIGEAKAFNVVLDLFDASSFDFQDSVAELDVNESYMFQSSGSGLIDNTTVVAVVDFDNLIDEENETNNIDFVIVTVYNTIPGNVSIISPENKEITDDNLIEIIWESVSDINGDFVRYFIDYSLDEESWFSIKNSFGYVNSWNDSSQNHLFNYSAGGGNETIYLRLPKNATISSAKINLMGVTK